MHEHSGVLQLARLLAARVTPLLRRMDLPAELVEEALRSANAQAKQHSSGKQLVTVKLGVYAAPV